VSLPVVVAAAMFAGVVVYAVLGGADFGSGFWDLTAGDARRGGEVRALVDHSIGPVWEANHVWLIYVLVFWWTAFPRAFAAVTTTLYLPLALALLGIVLRGASFAFRKYAATLRLAQAFGVVFATSSVVTPFFLGTVAGAIASGRVPAGGHGDAIGSWVHPTSLTAGVLAVGTCSFLAGVFLTADAVRQGDAALGERLRRGSLLVAAVTGAVVLAALVPVWQDAETLGRGLRGRAAPLVVLSAACGALTLWALVRRRYLLARFTAVGAVVAVVLGWGVAQYPWLLVDQLTIVEAAGARSTHAALLVVACLAAVVVVPPLAYLLWLTQQPERGTAGREPGPEVGPDAGLRGRRAGR
jgi:cytochrome d ubiquinol oxidase subunit II